MYTYFSFVWLWRRFARASSPSLLVMSLVAVLRTVSSVVRATNRIYVSKQRQDGRIEVEDRGIEKAKEWKRLWARREGSKEDLLRTHERRCLLALSLINRYVWHVVMFSLTFFFFLPPLRRAFNVFWTCSDHVHLSSVRCARISYFENEEWAATPSDTLTDRCSFFHRSAFLCLPICCLPIYISFGRLSVSFSFLRPEMLLAPRQSVNHGSSLRLGCISQKSPKGQLVYASRPSVIQLKW